MMGDVLNVRSAFSLTSPSRFATAVVTPPPTATNTTNCQCRCGTQATPIRVVVQNCQVNVPPGLPIDLALDALSRVKRRFLG